MSHTERVLRRTMLNLQSMFEAENNINQEPVTSMPMVSNCCGSFEREGFDEDTGVCAACKEHCDFIFEGEYDD